MRLVGGSDNTEGRVEVFHAGSWGTICDDGWDANDAAVVCAALGFIGMSEAKSNAEYGEGTGTIYLDDVDCAGSEDSLLGCSRSDWGSHNCGHHEDAGVRCGLDAESGINYLLCIFCIRYDRTDITRLMCIAWPHNCICEI